MNEDLLRFKNKQKYLVWDLETSNLAISSGLPWQIGYVTAQGKNITGEFERKIWWPEYKMDDQVAMLNHFDRFQYEREARDPKEVLAEFEEYLYDPSYIIVTMNGLGFDQYIHNNWRLALGKKSDYSWNNRHIDIMPVFRAIQMECKRADKDDLFCWQMRYLNSRDRKIKTSLSAQLKHFGIPFDESKKHDAIYDVDLTFQVFQKIIWGIEI